MNWDHYTYVHILNIWYHNIHGLFIIYIWVNYNDLTTTSGLIREIIPKWPYFRLVNYYNLPRYILVNWNYNLWVNYNPTYNYIVDCYNLPTYNYNYNYYNNYYNYMDVGQNGRPRGPQMLV